MAGTISSISYMGMLAILLMRMSLKTVDAVVAWDCSGKDLRMGTLNFTDLNNTELLTSLKKLSKYPDKLAYRLMAMEGYISFIKEDKFYIFQCNPVAGVVQPQYKCYDRLQIKIFDKNAFFTPWTHVITTSANEIPCNATNLQDYKVEANIYKVLPRPEGSLDRNKIEYVDVDPNDPSPIQILKPSTSMTWEYKELDNLATSGIYTEEQVDDAWQAILHPEYRRGYDAEPIPKVPIRYPINPNPNNLKIPWYKYDLSYLVHIGIAALFIIPIIIIFSLMLVGRIKHNSPLHFFRRGNSHRKMAFNQADLTVRFNKETV